MKPHIMAAATARWLQVVKEHSITQQQIADACGVSVATARRWRSVANDLKPTITQAYQLYYQWDISPSWIAYGVGPRRLSELEALTQEHGQYQERISFMSRAASVANSLERAEASLERLHRKIDA